MSLAKKAFIGSLTLTFSKFSERLLGLVSTLILARLLLPQDFGIIAISLLVIGFFSVVNKTGSGAYIIQKDELNDEDLNTAWTVDIIIKNSTFVILLVAAPYAADFYNDQRLASVIPILSFMMVLSSFSNPGFMLLRREQSYGAIFKLDIAKKAIAVIAMIIVALIYKNFWAMVVGHLVSNFIQLVGSYWLVKYRPAFSLKGVAEQWQFTKWILSKGMLGYGRAQLDTFLVSKFFGLTEVGSYHVMKYISTMPGTQIIEPATSPLLATFSRKKNDLEGLQHQYKLTLLVVLGLALPLTAYLYIFSLPIVQILLGDNWVEHHRIFAILSLLTYSFSVGNVSSQIIISTGKIKSLFYYDVVTLVLMVTVLLSAYNQSLSIQTFALYRVMLDWMTVTLLTLFTLRTILKLNILYFIGILFCSVLIAIIAGFVSNLTYIVEINVFVSLTISTIVFALTWLVGSYAVYRVYFHRTQEGAHLAFLISKASNKATEFWKRNSA